VTVTVSGSCLSVGLDPRRQRVAAGGPVHGAGLVLGDGQRPGRERHDAEGRAQAAVQCLGDAAHAADRHPPLAVAVAHHVVEEAAVLLQAGVAGPGVGADQGVGEHHAACGVTGEARLDQLAERALEQR